VDNISGFNVQLIRLVMEGFGLVVILTAVVKFVQLKNTTEMFMKQDREMHDQIDKQHANFNRRFDGLDNRMSNVERDVAVVATESKMWAKWRADRQT